MAGKLYVVATPIGNLGDISRRALDTLAAADFIAAEDTRVTLKLLSAMGISRPLISYYDHNASQSGPRIVGRILDGETCALVSDAGTPIVSDPGELLVSLAAEAGIEVLGVPGPCAMVNALAISGLPSGRFCFEGFLPVNKRGRREHLATIANETRTMIFYEAPHKLQATLSDLQKTLGNRRIAVCREMTKLFEEVLRTTLDEAAAHFEETKPRGEFVLVIEGAPFAAAEPEPEDAVALAKGYIEDGLSTRDAAAKAAADTGVPKNKVYAALLKSRED